MIFALREFIGIREISGLSEGADRMSVPLYREAHYSGDEANVFVSHLHLFLWLFSL